MDDYRRRYLIGKILGIFIYGGIISLIISVVIFSISKYNSAEEYTLYIQGVKSISGKGLKDEITMDFSIANNTEEVIKFPDENLERSQGTKLWSPKIRRFEGLYRS